MQQSLYNPVTNSFSSSPVRSDRLFQVMWHITTQCENNCVFCLDKQQQFNSEHQLRYNHIDEAILLLKELGVQKIDISGGEPLLCDKLIEIVQGCKNASICTTLTTSGHGNTSNLLWLSQNWDSFSRVILSLDGLELEHNLLRKNPVAYSNFYNCYCSLLQSGCDRLRINTVVTNKIMSDDYLSSFSDIIKKLHPKEWCIIKPYKKTIHSSASDIIDISDEQFDSVYNICSSLLKDTNVTLLKRANNEYSSYWTLNSSNILSFGDSNVSYDIPFIPENIFAIKQAINSHDQVLPTEV